MFYSDISKGTQVIERQQFSVTDPCDLNLCPTDPKNNRVLLLNKGNQYMKFEVRRWNSTKVIKMEMVFSLREPLTLTFDLLTPKAIRFLSLKSIGETVLKLLSGNGFQFTGPCELDLWPTDAKNTRDLLLNKGNQQMKFEVRRWNDLLKLLSRNSFQFTGPCDLDLWRTDPKNIRDLLFNKGNQHMKFEVRRSNGNEVIIRKRFSVYGPLWPWPPTYWPQKL